MLTESEALLVITPAGGFPPWELSARRAYSACLGCQAVKPRGQYADSGRHTGTAARQVAHRLQFMLGNIDHFQGRCLGPLRPVFESRGKPAEGQHRARSSAGARLNVPRLDVETSRKLYHCSMPLTLPLALLAHLFVAHNAGLAPSAAMMPNTLSCAPSRASARCTIVQPADLASLKPPNSLNAPMRLVVAERRN